MTHAYVTSEAATATAIINSTDRTGETAFLCFLKLLIFIVLLLVLNSFNFTRALFKQASIDLIDENSSRLLHNKEGKYDTNWQSRVENHKRKTLEHDTTHSTEEARK
jgi:hypothetical protein